MPRAVVKDGLIYPLDPLPPDWTNGKEVWVDDALNPRNGKASDDANDSTEDWFEELESLCADSNAEDEAKIEAAIEEHRQRGKALMRREMGLSE